MPRFEVKDPSKEILVERWPEFAQFAPAASSAFAGKTIAVTGATGFLGSVVIRDLLRLCPTATHVYACIRPRPGAGIYARLQEVIERPIFDGVRGSAPASLARLSALEYDMEKGLPQLPQSVSLIIHCARASVRGHLAPTKIIKANYTGLQQLLCVATTLRASVVTISSTGSLADFRRNCTVEECVYALPTPHDELCHQLMVSGKRAANRIVSALGFPSAHQLSYRMCELLLEEWHTGASMNSRRNGSRGAIVRASDIMGLAGGGSLRGYAPKSSSLLLSGIMELGSARLRETSLQGTDVLALVPVDLVSSLVVGVSTWILSKESSEAFSSSGKSLAMALDYASADPFYVFHACSSGARAPLTFGRYSRVVSEHYDASADASCAPSLRRAASKLLCKDRGVKIIRRFDELASNRRYETKNTYGLQLLLNGADDTVARRASCGEPALTWDFLFPATADDWDGYLADMCTLACGAPSKGAQPSKMPNPLRALRAFSTRTTISSSTSKTSFSSRSSSVSSGNSMSSRKRISRGATFKYSDFWKSAAEGPAAAGVLSPGSPEPEEEIAADPVLAVKLSQKTFMVTLPKGLDAVDQKAEVIKQAYKQLSDQFLKCDFTPEPVTLHNYASAA